MIGWVAQEKASVHNPGAELIETTLQYTPPQGDSSFRFFWDI
jgi:hypothetical protein